MKYDPKNIPELATLYNVHKDTIGKWLKPIRKQLLEMSKRNSKRLRVLSSKQVDFIIKFLGEP